jgi:hypothetical protein
MAGLFVVKGVLRNASGVLGQSNRFEPKIENVFVFEWSGHGLDQLLGNNSIERRTSGDF